VFAAVVAISVVQMLVATPFGISWDLGRHWVALVAYIGGMVGVVAIVIVGPGPLDALTASCGVCFVGR